MVNITGDSFIAVIVNRSAAAQQMDEPLEALDVKRRKSSFFAAPSVMVKAQTHAASAFHNEL